MKIFEDPQYEHLFNFVINKLDKKNLTMLSLVNRRFYLLVKKLEFVLNVVELMTQSIKFEIDGENYLSCDKLNIYCIIQTTADFYPNLIKELIRPFRLADIIDTLLNLPYAPCDINYQGNIRKTLLHFSICDIDAIQLLIAKGADINAQDEYGFTALHYGIKLPAYDHVVKLLQIFAENKFNFNLKDIYQKNIIDYILENFEKSYDPSLILNMVSILPIDDLLIYLSEKRITDECLFISIASKLPEHEKALKMILEKNKIVTTLSTISDQKHIVNLQIEPQTKVKSILSDSLISMIFSYLDKDAFINISKTSKKFKLLCSEIILPLLPIVASHVVKLLDNCYETKIEGRLYFGSENLNLLFEKNPKLYFNFSKQVIKPFRPVDIVAFLIQQKFDICYRGNLGQTLLHFMICDLEAVKLLIKNGANVNARDCYDNTALHYEISRSSPGYLSQLLEILSAANFDFEIQNDLQKTVIDYLFGRFTFNTSSDLEQNIQLVMALPFEKVLQYLIKSENKYNPLFEKLSKLRPEYEERLIYILETNKNKKNANNQIIKNYSNIPSSVLNFFRQTLENIPSEKHLSILASRLLEYLIKGSIEDHNLSFIELYKAISQTIKSFSHLQLIELVLGKCQIDQPLFMNKSLLHFFIIVSDFASIKFLVERGIDVNSQDVAKNTSLHAVAEYIDFLHDERASTAFLNLIILFQERGFKFNLVNSSGYTVCRLILESFSKVNLSLSSRNLLFKLLTVTYVNPIDALNHYAIYDEILRGEIDLYLKNQFLSNDMDFFPVSEPLKKVQPKINLPTDAFSQQVYTGMQLKLCNSELRLLKPEEELKIRAYRLIGLITHSWVFTDDDISYIELSNGNKYCSDDVEFLDFYNTEITDVVDRLNSNDLINKAIELGFDVTKSGRYDQTLLHFFAALNREEAITLLLSKGALVNAKDFLGETPLVKIINMLNNIDYREYVSCNAIKNLINAGAVLPKTIANFPLSQYLIDDFLGNINNKDVIDAVAFLLTRSNHNVIKLIDQKKTDNKTAAAEKEQLIIKVLEYQMQLSKQLKIGLKRYQFRLSDAPNAKRKKPNEDDNKDKDQVLGYTHM